MTRMLLALLILVASGGVNLDAGGQGTTTQVLHGNASGPFSWGSVADGDLANAYSGTGACAANKVASTLNRNAAPTCQAAPNLVRVSGSNFTTTSTGASTITGLSWSSAASTPYYFHCALDVTGTATGGPQVTVTVTTSTITSIAYQVRGHTTSATAQTYTGGSASGTLSAACTSSCLTTDIPFVVEGMVNINANAGTIAIAAANSTSGQTTTVKIGSMCQWWTP